MYSEMLETMSHSTDDFLFVLDIQKDLNYFFGNIDRDYAIRREGQVANTIQEMVNIVYPKDRHALLEQLDAIARGEIKEHNLDYRWVNKQGKVVWISCRGKVLDNDAGEPAVMVGRVSE